MDPAVMAHWVAIMAACHESVRVPVHAWLATQEPETVRGLIEWFKYQSIPCAVANLRAAVYSDIESELLAWSTESPETCPGCGAKMPGGVYCPACVKYNRNLRKRAARPPCRCHANGCNECEDRGLALAEMRMDRL